MISGSRTALNKAQREAKNVIGDLDRSRVQFLIYEELVDFLEKLDATAASTEKTVRGYKVKTSYKPISEAEKRARKKVIAETILTALTKERSAQEKREKGRKPERR
jgi:hypothetical protein